MGNCLKKTIFTESYLFEPLNSNDESIFNDNQNKNYCSDCVCTSNTIRIEDIEYKIADLYGKIKLLEKNTQQNLKLLSDDVHYINETINENN
tara:strand:+ start:162 stop:437 length:276 start_codon:yes stop_codon:yes gene_type:complete